MSIRKLIKDFFNFETRPIKQIVQETITETAKEYFSSQAFAEVVLQACKDNAKEYFRDSPQYYKNYLILFTKYLNERKGLAIKDSHIQAIKKAPSFTK